MISRHWRGVAKAERADEYVEHFRSETLPQLSRIAGFVTASILRRSAANGVEFLIVTQWESVAAIAKFAGNDIDVAVVPLNVQQMMIEFDRTVRHYDVVPISHEGSSVSKVFWQ